MAIGMAKAGADVYGSENQGGFASDDSTIIGFSHMHDSGTGGVRFLDLHQLHIPDRADYKVTINRGLITLVAIIRKLPHLPTSRMS